MHEVATEVEATDCQGVTCLIEVEKKGMEEEPEDVGRTVGSCAGSVRGYREQFEGNWKQRLELRARWCHSHIRVGPVFDTTII